MVRAFHAAGPRMGASCVTPAIAEQRQVHRQPAFTCAAQTAPAVGHAPVPQVECTTLLFQYGYGS